MGAGFGHDLGLGSFGHGLGLDGRLDSLRLDDLGRLGCGIGLSGVLLGDLLADLCEGRSERVVDAALRLLDGLRAVVAATLTTGPTLTRRPGRSLLGLLERETQAMALGIKGDDLELQRLTLVDDIARMGHALVRELADVDEALQAVLDADEGAEVHDLRDRAIDEIADGVAAPSFAEPATPQWLPARRWFGAKDQTITELHVDDVVVLDGERLVAIVVLGDDYRNVEPVYEKVHALVNDGVTVSRWTELDTYLGTMLRVMDGFVVVWVIIIFLALSFGLVNTLVMAVFERVREIGLMLALGMKPSSILGQIVIESMMLLVIGLAIGNLLAWASIKPLESGIDVSVVAEGMAMMGAASVLYPQLRLEDVILANTVVLILGFFASLSPAWRASRFQPIEAITKVN